MSAADYGRSLKGMGVNLLVRDVQCAVAFQTGILQVTVLHQTPEFAVMSHDGYEWMLHADSTFASHPLLELTGDNSLRGVGVELRLYNTDPDAAEARARAAKHVVFQESADKPHGLRECVIIDPDGYAWIPACHRV